jgi:hypothetical protein
VHPAPNTNLSFFLFFPYAIRPAPYAKIFFNLDLLTLRSRDGTIEKGISAKNKP